MAFSQKDTQTALALLAILWILSKRGTYAANPARTTPEGHNRPPLDA